MKKFTSADLSKVFTEHKTISCLKSELIEKPMWYHKRGLSQTATGYGKKLNTGLMIHFENRLRRIYCHCFSNVGTCYILVKGETIIIQAH